MNPRRRHTDRMPSPAFRLFVYGTVTVALVWGWGLALLALMGLPS